VRVIGPPATPVLRVPDGVGIGAAYSISLLEVADATRYEIDESTDGANWSLIAGIEPFPSARAAEATSTTVVVLAIPQAAAPVLLLAWLRFPVRRPYLRV
jgi:hypothetical protein